MAGGAEKVVDDSEDICRLCFKAGVPITVDGAHPDDIDPGTGLLRVTQLSQQDLTKRGFSVQILSRYSQQQALAEPSRKEAERRAKKKSFAGYKLAGVLRAGVGAIHAISDENGVQAFRVIEDPTHQSAAHAKILLSPQMKGGPYLKWRVELVATLGTVQPCSVLPSRPEGIVSSLRELVFGVRNWVLDSFGRWR